jgi:hypothetical protein
MVKLDDMGFFDLMLRRELFSGVKDMRNSCFKVVERHGEIMPVDGFSVVAERLKSCYRKVMQSHRRR